MTSSRFAEEYLWRHQGLLKNPSDVTFNRSDWIWCCPPRRWRRQCSVARRGLKEKKKLDFKNAIKPQHKIHLLILFATLKEPQATQNLRKRMRHSHPIFSTVNKNAYLLPLTDKINSWKILLQFTDNYCKILSNNGLKNLFRSSLSNIFFCVILCAALASICVPELKIRILLMCVFFKILSLGSMMLLTIPREYPNYNFISFF